MVFAFVCSQLRQTGMPPEGAGCFSSLRVSAAAIAA
jgi:hypothetical protein